MTKLPFPPDLLEPLVAYLCETWRGLDPSDALAIADLTVERRVRHLGEDEIRARIEMADVPLAPASFPLFDDATFMGRIMNVLRPGVPGSPVRGEHVAAAVTASGLAEFAAGEVSEDEVAAAAEGLGILLLPPGAEEGGLRDGDHSYGCECCGTKMSSDAFDDHVLTLIGSAVTAGELDSVLAGAAYNRDSYIEALGSALEYGDGDQVSELISVVVEKIEVMGQYAHAAHPEGFDSRDVRVFWKTPSASGKIGRNDLCPCGSGAKLKRCCGA
jgi:hypothetical protein